MNAAVAPVVDTRTWSPYQEGIYTFVAADPNDAVQMALYGGKKNAIVKAVAGSGKSTTVEQAVKRIRAGLSHVVLAFNKPIADAMKARGINGRTFHSLVFSIVMGYKKQRDVAKTKLRDLIDAKMTGEDARMYGTFVARLVGLGRNNGIGCLEADTPDAWLDLVEHHDLELENEHAKLDRAVALASEMLEAAYQSPLVDFDDMMYIAVRDGLSLPKFDFVFVDEAQDTNAIQRAILRKIMKPSSRLIAVGDPAQAIYGFRGADSNSLQLIADEFDCTELPLTVSYRCPTTVVAYAHKWVKHIEAAPNAPAGEVKEIGTNWNAKTFVSGDLIVCRTTKPLVSLIYQLIKLRVPAVIMGREVGAGLVSLVKKLNGQGIDGLTEKLFAWSSREHEKAIAKKQDAKAEAIIDKRDCILTLIEALEENDRTVPALIRLIESLFSDKAAAVTLATIHKSKGLEGERVFWLNHKACPAMWARQEWQQQQERNLCYVATTRAKASLFLMDEKVIDREAAPNL